MITFEILFFCFVSWLIILGCIFAGDWVGEKIIGMMEADLDREDLEFLE